MAPDLHRDLDWVAGLLGARAIVRTERIQSLWGGYGELFRVHLVGAAVESVVVKWIAPPGRSRGAASDRAHARKSRSYEVETQFYRSYASRTSSECRVPALIGWRREGDQRALVLEDLDGAGFAGRRRSLRSAELEPCLAWLAAFHAQFLGARPDGLWKTGTYWHLTTRPDELAAIDDEALRRAAPILDQRLRSCSFQTLVHGDAKLANFCFDDRAGAVAAVDFQYVGGGCGVQDVAYFLSSCSRAGEQLFVSRNLDLYFARLRGALERAGRASDVDALEREWRALYPIACADFFRFLAGWAPEEWRADRAAHQLVRRVCSALGGE